jgi:beta-glucosidase/6-phospho-beta-glucosidase/beta-galactosidase
VSIPDWVGNSGAMPPPIQLIGAFESTYQPHHDSDVAETTDHIARRLEDLELLREHGVTRLRYPVRWHRIESSPGEYDWSDADESMTLLREMGFTPIVDLVHHTSYPNWLTCGFADPRFADAYLAYAEAFARRYPWVEEYTLFNEPFPTLFLCGHEAIWPPYQRGMRAFVAMMKNVLPAIAEASRRYRELLPHARHVYVDSCERHTFKGAAGEAYARYANDRRFFMLDALLGRIDRADRRPFVEEVIEAGGDSLLQIEPGHVDIVGLDYYAHCQWHFGNDRGVAPTPSPPPLADLIVEYAQRYRLPCALTETNVRGYGSDRATWLKYVLEQYEAAAARGVVLDGLCWFPFVDSCDWDSLLYHCNGNVDPVGVISVDDDGNRWRSSMSRAFEAVSRGATSSDLPAYILQEPVATWLAGYRPQMAHWTWQRPPADEIDADEEFGAIPYEPLTIRCA